MVMEKALLKKVKSINLSDYPDVHKYTKALEKALWALLVVKTGLKCSAYFSPSDISEILLEVEVSCKPLNITRALARAGDMVDKQGTKSKSTFKIMKKGEDHLKKIEGKGKLNVLYLDGTRPWSDRKILSNQFIKNLKGEVLIVDKYFGGATLDILAEFSTKQTIKFLTAKIVDHGAKFKRDLKRFKSEHKHIEIRIYPKEHELHDRYLLTKMEICLLGHGLKDIGTKESFVLVLHSPAGKEIGNTLRNKFSERWAKAQNI